MHGRWFAVLALVAALGLFTPSASAGHAQGKGKDKGKGNPKAATRQAQGDDEWERHDKYDMRIYGDHDGLPPGWSKGKKTGWGNCGLPPGQAKKYACRTYVYQNRRYYYYRDDAGRIIVRRPRIEIHAVMP